MAKHKKNKSGNTNYSRKKVNEMQGQYVVMPTYFARELIRQQTYNPRVSSSKKSYTDILSSSSYC